MEGECTGSPTSVASRLVAVPWPSSAAAGCATRSLSARRGRGTTARSGARAATPWLSADRLAVGHRLRGRSYSPLTR